MYNRVNIGSPAGWGSRSAPNYGLSVYGGVDLCTDEGDVQVGGNLKLTRAKGLLWDYAPNTGLGGYVAHPGGGMYRNSSGNITGALTITLPSGGGPADMVSFWVDVFDYTSYESQSFYIAGYVYQSAGSNEWVNETALMLTPKENHSRTVRFGHDGTNHVVYIGELADIWSYPQVTVRNVQVGYASDVDLYNDNWSISFQASAFQNVDATYSGADTLPTAGKIQMKSGAGKFVHNNTSSRDKIRVWTSGSYAIGMQTGNNYGGLVNQYAMTFNMNDQSTRGFLWCDDGHGLSAGAMALTTDGKLTVAHSMRLGYGESDTTTPGASYKLDVSGNARFTADARCEGRFLSAPGTAAAPAYSFYSDGDTGMYKAGANQLGFSTGGNTRLLIQAHKTYINSTGANGLVINNDEGTLTNSGRIFFETTNYTTAIMQENDDFSIRTGATTGSSSGTERFKINSNGTVTVVGSQVIGGALTANFGAVFNETANDSNFRVESVGNPHMISVDASTNRVGIGTGSPSYDFHVAGHAYASSSFLGPDGSAATPSYRFHNDGNTGMYRLGDDDLGFSAGGSLKYGILNGLNRFYSNVVVGPNNNNSKPYIQYKDGFIALNGIESVSYTHLTLPTNREV